MEISASTGSAAYLELLDQLFLKGERSSPRGQQTTELRNVTLRITSAEHCHVLETSRNPSARIAATEAAQLVAGVSSLEQLDLASGGKFSQFADDGRLRGAYGPRAHGQLENAVKKLMHDPDTRQAVVAVYAPDDSSSEYRDIPCTITWQFGIRSNYLEMRTSMRSNDVFLGLPYDLEFMSSLHQSLALALRLSPGEYTHTVWSAHAYDRDAEKLASIRAVGLTPPVRPHVGAFRPQVLTSGTRSVAALIRWREITAYAQRTVLGGLLSATSGEALVPALRNDALHVCPVCRYVVSVSCHECEAIPPAGVEPS